jgi:hypothetical protein
VLVPSGTPVATADAVELESREPELAGLWEVATVVPLATHLRLLVRRLV